MQEKLEMYFNLGNALYKFYDGQALTTEELTLIAVSSNDDKIMALNLNATKRLGIRTDQSLNRFNDNNKFIEMEKFTNKKR